MKNYYYQITYQTAKYLPSKSTIYYGDSVADAKLYAYAVLGAYTVNDVMRVNKP